jgi:hypothetical protein
MLNPEFKFAKSKGIDIPTMYIYLVGRISGNCMNECLSWRKQIIEHYRNYKPIFAQDGETIVDYEAYPISFICPLNSGESKTADKMGLKSHFSKNLIYDKDILSLHKADAIVANLDDFMEVGLEDYLIPNDPKAFDEAISEPPNFDYVNAYNKLKDAILNRRANLGSHFEVSVALYLRKPVILIAGNERNKYILDNHPFFNRASVIVLNTDQLLREKWIQVLYKSMAGSTVEY